MSHQKPLTITRRSLLANSAAGIAAAGFASAGLPIATASAAPMPAVATGNGLASHALCKAHHKELSAHLSTILNSSYVDERMKNKMLSTSHCPHCKVAIAPEMKDRAAFAALA